MNFIEKIIKIKGSLKISEFMHEALFNQIHGYYQTTNPIGKNADFITSPEISQVFGELIAAYFLEFFSLKKNQISLVEMGAGKGTLFFDILTTINKLAEKKLPQAIDFIKLANFNIIEINPVLKEIQQKKLKNFQINWWNNFDQFLENNSDEIFFISNELLDCFPIDQFIKTQIGWQEKLVDLIDDKLEFRLAKFDQVIHGLVEEKIKNISKKPQIGSIFEYSFPTQNFITQLGEAIKKFGGIAINIDYGYFESDFSNSLQALQNHQKTLVLENVGNSDITALVDFSSLIKIIEKLSLNFSYLTQKEFLISLGIEEREKTLIINKNQKERKEINLAIDRLISSAQMGELFKCLIFWK